MQFKLFSAFLILMFHLYFMYMYSSYLFQFCTSLHLICVCSLIILIIFSILPFIKVLVLLCSAVPLISTVLIYFTYLPYLTYLPSKWWSTFVFLHVFYTFIFIIFIHISFYRLCVNKTLLETSVLLNKLPCIKDTNR